MTSSLTLTQNVKWTDSGQLFALGGNMSNFSILKTLETEDNGAE